MFDIVIIGGSFAGMTAALSMALIDSNLKVAIIEKQDVINFDRKSDGRAYAISSSSLSLFKEIGIFDQVNPLGGTIADIQITDYKSSFILDFIGQEVDKKNPELGKIIENHHIHNALRDRVLQQKNIQFFCPNFYQKIQFFDNRVELLLDDQKVIVGKLLLACDGRFSKLRDLYQIHTVKKHYQQVAMVFNISHQKPHNNVAHEKFFPGGPLAILPLQNQYQSSIVWIVKEELAPVILGLDEENFLQQLQKKTEGVLGEVKLITPKFSYPLVLIEANQFYHQKMLLIGDAACGVHPIAGQGFNLAIVGIKILRDLIKANVESGLDIAGPALIAAYNKKAKTKAKAMLIATDVLNSLFETKNSSLSLARDVGLGIVNKIPRIKHFFIKAAGGLR